MAASFVYVSSADSGDIGVYHLGADGSLTIAARVPAGKAVMPLAVSPDRRRLYAAIRSQPFSVSTYSIDARSGMLEKISTGAAAESFAYISTDRSGRFLFGASYGGHLVAVHPIDGAGRIATALQVIPIERNAHCIRIDRTNRYVFVPALGTDRIFQFVFDADAGRLIPNTPPALQLAAGTGPRHAIFSNDDRFLYVLNELTGTVTVFAIDASGVLKERESQSILPPGSTLRPGAPRGAAGAQAGNEAPRNTDNDIWASDVHLTPDGRFLYAAERTGSTLSVMRVDVDTGSLTYAGGISIEKQPRGFAIDPSGKFVVVSGEKSETISSYAIGADGMAQPAGRCETGKGSNWVEIIEAE